jgi:hypothetical protein
METAVYAKTLKLQHMTRLNYKSQNHAIPCIRWNSNNVLVFQLRQILLDKRVKLNMVKLEGNFNQHEILIINLRKSQRKIIVKYFCIIVLLP